MILPPLVNSQEIAKEEVFWQIYRNINAHAAAGPSHLTAHSRK